MSFVPIKGKTRPELLDEYQGYSILQTKGEDQRLRPERHPPGDGVTTPWEKEVRLGFLCPLESDVNPHLPVVEEGTGVGLSESVRESIGETPSVKGDVHTHSSLSDYHSHLHSSVRLHSHDLVTQTSHSHTHIPFTPTRPTHTHTIWSHSHVPITLTRPIHTHTSHIPACSVYTHVPITLIRPDHIYTFYSHPHVPVTLT